MQFKCIADYVVVSYRLKSDKPTQKRVYIGSIFCKKIQNNSIQEVMPRIFSTSYRRASRIRLQKDEEKGIETRHCDFEHECWHVRRTLVGIQNFTRFLRILYNIHI